MSDIVKQYLIEQEPYYRPVADEVELFEAAYSVRMPMMLKGPTGCGKTRFVEYMAHKLNKPLTACRVALVRPITDDPDMRDALDAAVTTFF